MDTPLSGIFVQNHTKEKCFFDFSRELTHNFGGYYFSFLSKLKPHSAKNQFFFILYDVKERKKKNIQYIIQKGNK